MPATVDEEWEGTEEERAEEDRTTLWLMSDSSGDTLRMGA